MKFPSSAAITFAKTDITAVFKKNNTLQKENNWPVSVVRVLLLMLYR